MCFLAVVDCPFNVSFLYFPQKNRNLLLCTKSVLFAYACFSISRDFHTKAKALTFISYLPYCRSKAYNQILLKKIQSFQKYAIQYSVPKKHRI
jgi:hypothetical protein